jgi:hypothetical protein
MLEPSREAGVCVNMPVQVFCRVQPGSQRTDVKLGSKDQLVPLSPKPSLFPHQVSRKAKPC